MLFAAGITVTLVSRTVNGTDADGNDVWAETTTDIKRCAFDPGASSEVLQGRDTVITQPTLYLPRAVAVTPTDQFVVNGRRYDVDGSVDPYTNPFTGWSPGTVVRLMEVTG